jgi:GNAT superfamily N-acetyltransferase
MHLEDVNWRAMTAFDLKAVSAIAEKVHPGLFESEEVLAERQQLYRNGAYVLEIGTRAAGYVFSHPWRAGAIPALNTPLGGIPQDADTYYIHDLALLPMARRIGAASDIVAALGKHAGARGFASMSLVAVGNSQGFWEKQGFAVVPTADLAADATGKLAGYGPDARFMAKPLGASDALHLDRGKGTHHRP